MAYNNNVLIFTALLSTCISVRHHPCKFNNNCRCTKINNTTFQNADCSLLGVKDIPIIPNYLREINFDNNMILQIPENSFENNSALTSITIAFNKLQSLNVYSFNGLDNILTLSLNNNHITYIASDTFVFLQHLSLLDLKKNAFDAKHLNLKMSSSLQTLLIDFVQTVDEPLTRDILDIENLNISGLSGNCEIHRLTPKTLAALTKLQKLDLSACKISYIVKGSFQFMKHLTWLDLSFNPCLKFDGLANVVEDLRFTSISVLRANKIHKTFELNTMLRNKQIEGLFNTNLIELHLESNRLQKFEEGALQKLPHTIRKLFLSDNNLSFGKYFGDVKWLPVEFVNLSNLFSTHSPPENEEICLNFTEELCQTTNQYNKESEFNVTKFGKDSGITLYIPRNLTTLIYKNCLLRFEIPEFSISNNSVEYIDGSFNLFNKWTGPVKYLNKTKYLELSNNFCSNVSKVFFQSIPNVKTLCLQNNLLGFVLPEDSKGEIFQHNPYLETLDLALNRIPNLPLQIFKHQIEMKNLILSGNLLEKIMLNISHMKNLGLLDFSNNRLAHISKALRHQLDSIMSFNSNLTIDLSNNPLICTCDTIHFVEWLSLTNVRFRNKHNYTCQTSEEESQSLKDPKKLYGSLQRKCSHYTTLIIVLVAVIVVFLLALTWGLVHRYRWRLRYAYYMIINKQHRNVSKSDNRIYDYDAFISYADEDGSFVHDLLRRNLEDDGGLTLCLHKRDFLPGNDIAANITSAIHRSRKVVVIMSHAFLDSYWCMFEYNMARVESIYSRNKETILFLVFYEQISPKELPLIVLELVQSKSYIEYPKDEYGDTVFWNKLKEVLS